MPRIAVIGLGKMGLLHASILSAMPEVRLVALCERNTLKSAFAGKLLHGRVETVTRLKDLRRFDLDAVYVTTAIPTHHDIVRSMYLDYAVSNIFVEKTLASTYEEANDLSRIAMSHRGADMVGYQRRYSATFVKGRELLRAGMIGQPSSFRAYAYSSDFVDMKHKHIEAVSASRGGVLRDLGSHAVDLALWFFGDLQVVGSHYNASVRGSEEVGFAVRGRNGLSGRIHTSWSKRDYPIPEVGLVVEAGEGTLSVNDDKAEIRPVKGETLTWHRQDLDDSAEFVLAGTEFYREDRHFVACLEGCCSPNPDFADAAKVDLLIEQAERKL